jgi:hypothetical protein
MKAAPSQSPRFIGDKEAALLASKFFGMYCVNDKLRKACACTVRKSIV